MVIIGASGHAKEVFDCSQNKEHLYFFDNVTGYENPFLFDKKIIQSFDELLELETKKEFILGLGNVSHRFNLYQKFIELGFVPKSVFANNAQISSSANLGEGLNIMSFVFVGPDSKIGTGSLINTHASIHHDVIINDFVEVSPGAKLLGNCSIGSFSTIGTNATILPKIKIGTNVTVAAGAVVTKDIPDNCMVAGVPAQIKKELKSIDK